MGDMAMRVVSMGGSWGEGGGEADWRTGWGIALYRSVLEVRAKCPPCVPSRSAVLKIGFMPTTSHLPDNDFYCPDAVKGPPYSYSSLKSKRAARNLSINIFKLFIAHCPPNAMVFKFNATVPRFGAIHKSDGHICY
mmetsp:Transcript_14737/g.23305  ORF Transcript_14737/g.23305 Transcript_14737/m.23305 type:complete len:136 (-) Transcript_14737:572-979(-)